eukprot:scaffold435_cov342-Pavlova_lutheri.AAC.31
MDMCALIASLSRLFSRGSDLPWSTSGTFPSTRFGVVNETNPFTASRPGVCASQGTSRTFLRSCPSTKRTRMTFERRR